DNTLGYVAKMTFSFGGDLASADIDTFTNIHTQFQVVGDAITSHTVTVGDTDVHVETHPIDVGSIPGLNDFIDTTVRGQVQQFAENINDTQTIYEDSAAKQIDISLDPTSFQIFLLK